jgi:DNA-binding MarR family transcriptional regulator
MTVSNLKTSSDAGHVDDIIAGVRTALREMKCIGSERIVRRGLSMSTWHVLVMLERHGDVSMSRLADLLDVSLSNATGLVDRMEERGLIERVRVPDDRRVVLVRVSEAGRNLLTEVEVLGDEMIRRVLGRLDERQLARVAAAMRDMRGALVEVMTTESDGLWREHVHGQVHATAGVQPVAATASASEPVA